LILMGDTGVKCLIITVAGKSTRFSESVGKESIKCLYTEEGHPKSIIYNLVSYGYDRFDKIIIVGGFKYEELCEGINESLKEYLDKIVLVRNDHFSDFGSGYSLLLGLIKSFELKADEIVFAEGDLYVRREAFVKVCNDSKDVVTANNEVILAKKAVAFYTDLDEKIHYIYDTSHGALSIGEPFTSIRNSGQIWKFIDTKRLSTICAELSDEEKQGTNLTIIEKYFSSLSKDEYEVHYFDEWLNCNTVSDFRMIPD